MFLLNLFFKLFPSYRYFKELYLALSIILFIAFVGSFGYVIIEGFTYIEALYMTIITVSTVGFTEVRPLSEEGRIFTMFLIFTSFGTFAYTLTSLSKYVINGSYSRYYKKYRMDKHIDKIANHVVICGAGNNGSEAIKNLLSHNRDIVIIESNQELFDQLQFNDIPHIIGDATHDEVLKSAGIERASALITTLPKDTDNVFVVLTAKEFNPDLRIVSRCTIDSSESKLKSAGANSVIMPDKVGGTRMAGFVVNQHVNRFIDRISQTEKNLSNLKEIHASQLPQEIRSGKIKELKDYLNCSAKLIGLHQSDGAYIVNPSEELEIPTNCELFFLGTTQEIKKLRDRISN